MQQKKQNETKKTFTLQKRSFAIIWDQCHARKDNYEWKLRQRYSQKKRDGSNCHDDDGAWLDCTYTSECPRGHRQDEYFFVKIERTEKLISKKFPVSTSFSESEVFEKRQISTFPQLHRPRNFGKDPGNDDTERSIKKALHLLTLCRCLHVECLDGMRTDKLVRLLTTKLSHYKKNARRNETTVELSWNKKDRPTIDFPNNINRN